MGSPRSASSAGTGRPAPSQRSAFSTSPDRLHADWLARRGESHIARLLSPLARDAGLVTILDGHPAAHAWLGGVHGQAVEPLGVSRFGQAGDIPDLYKAYGLDAEAILDACARALLRR